MGLTLEKSAPSGSTHRLPNVRRTHAERVNRVAAARPSEPKKIVGRRRLREWPNGKLQDHYRGFARSRQ